MNNPPSFRYDGDGDGHGAQWSTPVPGCFAPAAAPEACSAMQANCPAEGWTVQVLPLDDCDDAAADRYPGAQEACNRRDDNCDKGGAEEPEEDVDGDGFTSVDYASCAGGFPKTDCYDLNADVRPGQTARFDVAYCLQPNAQMWCFTERQCAKTATCTDSIGQEWGPGSVDYDCDGVEEPLVPDPSEVARYDAACAAAEAPACVSPDAPSYAFSGAACGAVSRHMKCTNDSESGRCAYASTFLMTACR